MAMISGCVVVPHPVPADVVEIADSDLDPDLVVSAGPRRLIEKIGRRLADEGPVDVVDAIRFRDIAYPSGGWRLGDLLETDHARRVAEQAGVDYLVLIGLPEMSQWNDEKGGYFPGLAGVMVAEEKSTMAAAIIDLHARKPVVMYRVEATGTPVAVVWVVVGAIKDPMTASAVLEGLSTKIVQWVSDGDARGRATVAILAVEGGDNPLAAPQADLNAYNAQDEPRQ
jgi:hypothetical protein